MFEPRLVFHDEANYNITTLFCLFGFGAHIAILTYYTTGSIEARIQLHVYTHACTCTGVCTRSPDRAPVVVDIAPPNSSCLVAGVQGAVATISTPVRKSVRPANLPTVQRRSGVDEKPPGSMGMSQLRVRRFDRGHRHGSTGRMHGRGSARRTRIRRRRLRCLQMSGVLPVVEPMCPHAPCSQDNNLEAGTVQTDSRWHDDRR